MKLVITMIHTDNCTYADYLPVCIEYKSKEALYDLVRNRIKEALESDSGFKVGEETWNVFDNIYVPSTTRKQLIKNPELALALTEQDLQIKVQTLDEWFKSQKEIV